jgi:phosphoinositide-3-kinase regulatory subunit 4
MVYNFFGHSAVTTFPPSDASIFPRYVFKKVAHLITDSSLFVRVAFAQNIALLAETARRFLDVGHAVRLYEAVAGRHSREGSSPNDSSGRSPVFPEAAANLLGRKNVDSGDTTSAASIIGLPDNNTTMITNSYDSDLAVLHEVVFRWVMHITTDNSDHSSQSKQALLRGLPRLCNFFGSEHAFQILPIILAFLNDRKDWQLRAALCRHLPS